MDSKKSWDSKYLLLVFIHLAVGLFVKHYQKIAVFFKNIMLRRNKHK